MAAKTDNQLKLSDGRAIGYAEYGDLAGRPVMYLHGLPSSRLEMNNPNTIEVAERLHVRLNLCPNEGHTLFVKRLEELLSTVVC
jgi:pimeloyl-ACP methyl ester carboxylesterase